MSWILFGDDWGRHPSTTQHLAAALGRAGTDVVWINSIGMRSPRLSCRDLVRAAGKVGQMLSRRGGSGDAAGATSLAAPRAVLSPAVAPFHGQAWARAWNRRVIGRGVRAALSGAAGPGTPPPVLATTPVAVWYLEGFEAGPVIYLKLDEYTELPGVDADLIRGCEAAMIERADLRVATARALIPAAESPAWHYLPQGVDVDHFAGVPDTPPGTPTLGFVGLLAEWLDYDLIEASARACPGWRFVFYGPVRHVPERLDRVDNIELRGPIPYARIPEVMTDWTAAWVPFQVNSLTEGVNPLKLREYLAAGLPSLCTPLPEAAALGDDAHLVADAEAVARTLEEIRQTDTPARRRARKRAMQGESWAARARALQELAGGMP